MLSSRENAIFQALIISLCSTLACSSEAAEQLPYSTVWQRRINTSDASQSDTSIQRESNQIGSRSDSSAAKQSGNPGLTDFLVFDDEAMRLLLRIVHNPRQWTKLRSTLDHVQYNSALLNKIAHSSQLRTDSSQQPAKTSSNSVYMRWIPTSADLKRSIVSRASTRQTRRADHTPT